jgi:hypothetical protein
MAWCLAGASLAWAGAAPTSYARWREAVAALLRLQYFITPAAGLVARAILQQSRLAEALTKSGAPFFLFIMATEVVPLATLAFSWLLRLLPHIIVQAVSVACSSSRAPALCACPTMQTPAACCMFGSLLRGLGRFAWCGGGTSIAVGLTCAQACWAAAATLQVGRQAEQCMANPAMQAWPRYSMTSASLLFESFVMHGLAHAWLAEKILWTLALVAYAASPRSENKGAAL